MPLINLIAPIPVAAEDSDAEYWSPDDEDKPWNLGFGDGYVSEHGPGLEGWYAVTRGFKVGIFEDPCVY